MNRHTKWTFGGAVAVVLVLSASANADPVGPSYAVQFNDAVTGTNQIIVNGNRRWTVTPGADSYQNNFYERPTTQTFVNVPGGVGAAEYYGNLDIVNARVGFDSQYLYVAIDMFSTLHEVQSGSPANEGLAYRYGFRLSNSAADGANGFLFTVDQPGQLGTVYQLLKNEAFRDTNGDVGGAGGISVTKDNGDVAGNGYDLKVIADGRLNGAAVFFSRIDPNDPSIVEFALDYGRLGINPLSLLYLDFEAIKGGPKDPQNYQWNDKYTFNEAGTPYTTAGLQNLYELDTLQGDGSRLVLTPVPAPPAVILLGIGMFGLFGARLSRRRTAAV